MRRVIARLIVNACAVKYGRRHKKAHVVLGAFVSILLLAWPRDCVASPSHPFAFVVNRIILGDFWMNGERHEALPGGLFFEITGQWLSKIRSVIVEDGKLSDYTICIAIINPTDRSIYSPNGGGGNGYDRRTYYGVLTWKALPGIKSLAFEGDGRKRTIRIANQSFDLKGSNFFVVIFSPTWVPTITQVRDKLDIPPQLPTDTIIELQKRFASKVRKI